MPAFHVLCLNAGSSSLKFALYDLRELESVVMSGAAENIGSSRGRLKVTLRGRLLSDTCASLPSHEAAVAEAMSASKAAGLPRPTACVHRVVHGGPRLVEPVVIGESVRQELQELVALAPLHLPNELSVIDAARRAYPDSRQIACFDTAFHHRMPEIAKRLPLPRALWEQGLRRYGFHGLSYESIVAQLGDRLSGRSVIAHLGNGCSMVALIDGIPQDTTMGLTPTGGLMMGTRSGDLDPGALFYLMRSASGEAPRSIQRAEQIVNDESGLLGVSGISRNMEALLETEATSAAAREAIALFCYCAKKCLGSLWTVLGGMDTLAFTGGIGERSSVVRKRICEGLGVLGVGVDPARNGSNAPVISQENSPCRVRVLHTDENLMMARHASRLL
jgi:acetate kinase